MRLISAKIHSSFFLLTGTCNILAKDLIINIFMNKTLLILNENLKRTPSKNEILQICITIWGKSSKDQIWFKCAICDETFDKKPTRCTI